MTWKPTVVAGKPPKECVDCCLLPFKLYSGDGDSLGENGWRPKKPLETDHKPLKPRCRRHQRLEHNRTKAGARATYQARNFTVTPELHEAILTEQQGKCAVCKIATGKSKALATDHNHACCNGPTSCGNCVRGKLCSTDNQDLIGRVEYIAKANNESTTAVLLRIMDYFTDPPANRARKMLELINA